MWGRGVANLQTDHKRHGRAAVVEQLRGEDGDENVLPVKRRQHPIACVDAGGEPANVGGGEDDAVLQQRRLEQPDDAGGRQGAEELLEAHVDGVFVVCPRQTKSIHHTSSQQSVCVGVGVLGIPLQNEGGE